MNGQTSTFRTQLVLIFVQLTLILACHTTAFGQDLDEVSFAGVVADEHGAVLPGASVTARLINTGAARAAVTDGEGRYRLVELQPGAYTLRAERAGFAVEEMREVFTLAGQTVRLDFTLRPAGVAVEQTVLSGRDAPLIDTTRTVAGGTVTRDEMERLPIFSRSPLDFVFLLGGVTEEPLSTLYS
ncbi:MAG: carboxypeptidase-like regulatory domain-containing protein [Pyrinomonadaceae bacterium]